MTAETDAACALVNDDARRRLDWHEAQLGILPKPRAAKRRLNSGEKQSSGCNMGQKGRRASSVLAILPVHLQALGPIARRPPAMPTANRHTATSGLLQPRSEFIPFISAFLLRRADEYAFMRLNEHF